MIRAATALTIALAVPQVFRSGIEAVEISASVKRGNAPVANLAAGDFHLTDNGVPQMVQLLTVESVPIDVSLFLDTSGSTGGVQDQMRGDAAAIAAMLRPADRIRILTIGVTVDESVPWQDAGTPVSLRAKMVPGISLIYDALFAALAHRPAVGRRHLVVGLTDGEECGSVVDGPTLLEASGRTEAVLHVIYAHGSGHIPYNGVMAWCSPFDASGPAVVEEAASRTGGAMHRPMFRDPTVREFRKILDEFRASYVLRYSPRGVPGDGWHPVNVEVPSLRGVTVHARSGYFVGK